MQAFDRAYESVDVLLGATAPTTAFDLGAKVDDPMAMYMNDVCTIPSNLSGHPAMSVPFGTGDGRPAGRRPGAGARAGRGPALPSGPRGRGTRAGGRRAGAVVSTTSSELVTGAMGGEWEMVIRPRGPLRAGNGDEAVLRLSQRVRRRAQRQHLPDLHRSARIAARAQRAGGRAGHADRRGPALRDPALGLRPEELLLSRPGQGLPDQPVRPAAQRGRLAGAARRRPGGRDAGAHGRGHRQAHPRRARAAASTRPTTRWWTTTARACRWSRS